MRQDDRSRTEAPEAVVKHEREDDADARLTWWGARDRRLRVRARWGLLGYWFDWARVRGSERTVEYEALSPRRAK